MYDIYFDLNNMHQTVEETDNNPQLELFASQNGFDFDWINDLPKENVEDLELTDGQTCASCKDFYPYADRPNQKDGTFKCWSCRHSW